MFGSSFPLFKIAGIQVVTNWTIFLLCFIGAQGNSGMAGALALITTVLLHELGHALMAKSKGARVNNISIGFVGMASYSGQLSSAQSALVAFAGPLANIVSAVIALGVLGVGFNDLLNGPITEPSFLSIFLLDLAKWSLLLGIFNLIPALPMDGGWVLQHLLELKFNSNTSRIIALKVTLVSSLGLLVLGLLSTEIFLMLFGGYFFFIAWTEIKARGMFSQGAGLWESFVRERQNKSREKQEFKKKENEMEIRAKIDQLLVKISKEGMSSLSEAERNFLTEHSRQYPKN